MFTLSMQEIDPLPSNKELDILLGFEEEFVFKGYSDLKTSPDILRNKTKTRTDILLRLSESLRKEIRTMSTFHPMYAQKIATSRSFEEFIQGVQEMVAGVRSGEQSYECIRLQDSNHDGVQITEEVRRFEWKKGENPIKPLILDEEKDFERMPSKSIKSLTMQQRSDGLSKRSFSFHDSN